MISTWQLYKGLLRSTVIIELMYIAWSITFPYKGSVKCEAVIIEVIGYTRSVKGALPARALVAVDLCISQFNVLRF